MNKFFLIFFSVVLFSCASVGKPTHSLIDNIPVITVGESRDVSEEHIVFIPANTKFPITFSMKGEAFTEDLSSTVSASFKKDLYLYKYWASFDGRRWENSHKLISVKPSGGFDKSGGKLEVILDFME